MPKRIIKDKKQSKKLTETPGRINPADAIVEHRKITKEIRKKK